MMADELVVHLDASDLGGDAVVGTLRRDRKRTVSVISFAYDGDWLNGTGAFELDPSLRAHLGDQYPRALPGVFADTAPDRWGTILLERREAATAAGEGRRPRVLDQWDLLVLVSDELRMGALRFARRSDGTFVATGPRAVPPLARLGELEHLAQEIEHGAPLAPPRDDVLDLIAPGSSLGGNRPKANVRAADGSLWIAKFPSTSDRWDVGAWEYLLNQLAPGAGIAVPTTRLLGPLGSAYRIFSALRFDRDGVDRRLFASALTLSAKRDHARATYLDIVRAIALFGDPARIEEDLEQLFRRVVFNVLVGHRDDHLRNHGFLRAAKGWRLAPAYDLNPRPDLREHAIALDETLHAGDLDAVLRTATYYRLSAQRARTVADEVRAAVAPWRQEARRLDIPQAEIAVVEATFPL